VAPVAAGRDRTGGDETVRRSRLLAGAAAAGLGAGYVLERSLAKRWRVGADELAAAGLSMPSEVEHHFVPTDDGGRIHVVEAGAGPPIVLLHGITLGVGVWVRQFRALAGSHRLVALDLRGHGQSIAGSDGYAFERMADDLLEVLEARRVDRAVVVGHSMGGMVLQLTALLRAKQLAAHAAGIVLVGTDAGPAIPGPLGRPMGVATAALAGRAAGFADRRGKGVYPGSDLATWGARLSFGVRPDPAEVELVRSISAAVAPRAMAGLLGPLLAFDVRAELGRIDLPTLVVVGTRDLLTPPRRSRSIAGRVPGARLEVLPGCGHLVMLERPDTLNALLSSFSAELAV
jgi:3-oxoadipate enol-lactonase